MFSQKYPVQFLCQNQTRVLVIIFVLVFNYYQQFEPQKQIVHLYRVNHYNRQYTTQTHKVARAHTAEMTSHIQICPCIKALCICHSLCCAHEYMVALM